VEDFHDGEGLGDARKVVDSGRDNFRAVGRVGCDYAPEDGGPCDGRGGIVEHQVSLLGSKPAALRRCGR
jgi:hypothetical protein